MTNIASLTVESDINTCETYFVVAAECSVITERVVDGSRGAMNEHSALVEYIDITDEDGNTCTLKAHGPAQNCALRYFVGPHIAKALIADLEKAAIERAN